MVEHLSSLKNKPSMVSPISNVRPLTVRIKMPDKDGLYLVGVRNYSKILGQGNNK